MKRCPSCGSALDGAYCSSCGQKDVELARPIVSLVADVLRETFELDGRASRTLRTLFLHPGTLTAEFLAGRRSIYTPPLRLYLFASLAFFLLASWLATQGVLLDPGQSVEQDAPGQARFMSENLPKLMFLLLPAFALFLKFAMPGRLYFEHLLFSIHLHSAAYIALSFVLSLEYFPGLWTAGAQIALYLYLLAYFVLSLRRVYGKHWLLSSVIALGVLAVYALSISAVIEAGSTLRILSD